MKTISKLFGAVAAIAALAACNKDLATETPVTPAGVNSISINVAQPATKVTMLDNTGDLIWDEDEVIAAVLNDGAGNKFVAKLTQEGTASQGVATFKGDAPAGLNATNITDLYYPYIEGYEASQYANYTVSTTQDNLVPGDNKFALKDLLPLHWKGEGINDNVVTLSADRTAIVKVSKEDFTPVLDASGYMTIMYKDKDGEHVYKVKINTGEDLIFAVDVQPNIAPAPAFMLNYNSSNPASSTIFNTKRTSGKRTPLLAGHRYVLIKGQFCYPDFSKDLNISKRQNVTEIVFEVGNGYYGADPYQDPYHVFVNYIFADDYWGVYDEDNYLGSKKLRVQTCYYKFKPSTLSRAFYHYDNLGSVTGLDKVDLSECSNMSEMFSHCETTTRLDLSTLNTAGIKDMSWMFAECNYLTFLTLSDNFVIADDTNLEGMFWGAGCWNEYGGTIIVRGVTSNAIKNKLRQAASGSCNLEFF